MKNSMTENKQKIAYYEKKTGKKWDENATVLDCSNNQLSVLPELPRGLKKLYCSDNKLTVLPELPLMLELLDCSANQLSILPKLPLMLELLDCSDNKLSVLPKLVKGLEKIRVFGNKLKYYIEIKGDKIYKYDSRGFVAGKSKYVQMGCFSRLLKDWGKSFWNNDKEFPNDNSEKSNNRYRRFLEIKNYLDKY